MDAVVLDPMAELLAAPEGRYEWVDGSLVEMSPPPSEEHNDRSLFLAAILRAYVERHALGRVFADNFAQRLGDNVRIPDVAFFRKDRLGRIERTHSEGGADLVVEVVSPGSGARDRGEKFDEYEAAGVEEYWIVDPGRRHAVFYRLDEGVYRPVPPDAEGRAHSSAVPGFFVRVDWLWKPPTLLDAIRELGLL